MTYFHDAETAYYNDELLTSFEAKAQELNEEVEDPFGPGKELDLGRQD